MKCTNCSYEFSKEESLEGCKGCGSFGGCHLVKCPKCNYEQPLIPKWVEKFSGLLKLRKVEKERK